MSKTSKHILIVGAGSGIGKSITGLLSLNYKLSLTSRKEENLKNNAENSIYILDVLQNDNIDSLIKEIPPIDGLVYCPGITNVVPAHHLKEKSLREVMQVNFEAAAYITGGLLKAKKIISDASLLYISSQAVRYPFFGSSAYSASKAALEAYVLSLSKELQSKKIRANCIAPAYVESPMLEEARKNMSDSFVENMKKMHPGAFATSQDIATLAAFLLSDNSKSINGQVIEAGSFNINIPAL
ncbi:MAG: hypothetical protein C0592_08115 [Marinilabiliales bacterium]|nr:MAG: hypothetical protein C0592_08115 [Marinilabiliales bacterium]